MSGSKKSWIGGIVAAVALVSVGGAQAAITWTQTYAPIGGYKYLNGNSSDFVYYHDLTKGNIAPSVQTTSGGLYSNSGSFNTFKDSVDYFTSATLTLYFADDGGDGNEYVRFKIEGGSWSSAVEVGGSICNTGSRNIFTEFCRTDRYDDWGPYDLGVDFGAPTLPSIFDDNKLKVTLDAYQGGSKNDFWFKGSILTISGDTFLKEVPEPATLGLLGLGLVGLGVLRRRKTAA